MWRFKVPLAHYTPRHSVRERGRPTRTLISHYRFASAHTGRSGFRSAQYISADGILIAVGAEKADQPLGLLERLDKAVEQNPVREAIAEANVILMVLVESVHGELLCGQIPGA